MKQNKQHISKGDIINAWSCGTEITFCGKQYGVTRNNAKRYFLVPINIYQILNEGMPMQPGEIALELLPNDMFTPLQNLLTVKTKINGKV